MIWRPWKLLIHDALQDELRKSKALARRIPPPHRVTYGWATSRGEMGAERIDCTTHASTSMKSATARGLLVYIMPWCRKCSQESREMT